MSDETPDLPEVTNPALKKLLALPPAILEEISQDSEAFKPYLRVMAATQWDELHRMRGLLTPSQRLQLAEATAKLADMEPKKNQPPPVQGSGFSIQINIPSLPTSVVAKAVDTSTEQLQNTTIEAIQVGPNAFGCVQDSE